MVSVGIVGAGTWGKVHAQAYGQHGSAELAAVCDVDAERAQALAQHFGIPKAFTNIDEMLEEELDGISVVTPDTAHAETVLKAAAKGIHVLVEKPLATTLAECHQMVAAAADAGIYLMVDLHNRWNPPYYQAWEAIRSGEMGDVRYIYYRLSDTVYVPTKMLPWAQDSSVLWFLGSHALDTTCWLMGKRPVTVYCQKQEGVLASLGVDTADLYLTVLNFEDGAMAVIENSWIIPQVSPSLIDHQCEIIGTEGTLRLDLTHHRSVAKYSRKTGQGYPFASFPDTFISPMIHGKQMGFAVESIYHFVDCLREGSEPLATGLDGLRNTQLILAAERSAQRGERVEVHW